MTRMDCCHCGMNETIRRLIFNACHARHGNPWTNHQLDIEYSDLLAVDPARLLHRNSRHRRAKVTPEQIGRGSAPLTIVRVPLTPDAVQAFAPDTLLGCY